MNSTEGAYLIAHQNLLSNQNTIYIQTLKESSLVQLHYYLGEEQKAEDNYLIVTCEVVVALCRAPVSHLHPYWENTLFASLEWWPVLLWEEIGRRYGNCFPVDLLVALLIKLIFSAGDFTNIFYLLSSFSVDIDNSKFEDFLEELTSQCASVEELKVVFKPQMDPRYYSA